MTSSLGPWRGGVGIKLKMGTYWVKKTYKLIRLTSTSLLMTTRKSMASSMVTIQITD
jgi:hypothetical protein